MHACIAIAEFFCSGLEKIDSSAIEIVEMAENSVPSLQVGSSNRAAELLLRHWQIRAEHGCVRLAGSVP